MNLKNQTQAIGKVILSVLLLFVLAGAAVLIGIGVQRETPSEGGAIITPGGSRGISLLSVKLSPKDYAANGISPLAETAYSLTATITPEDATNKAVDWTVSFVDPSAEWAAGKTVTDYVTVTPTSDGALTANVECLQDFGEQIKVTVTSRDNTAVSADCLVDYTQKLESVKATFGSAVLSDGMTKSFDLSASGQAAQSWTFDYTTSDYTVADDYVTAVEISFAEGVSAVESAVGVEFTWAGETITSGMPAFDKTFFDKVFVTASGAVSADPVQYNKLVNALSAGVTLFEVEVSTTGTYGSKTDTYAIRVTSDGMNIRVEGIELNDTNIVF